MISRQLLTMLGMVTLAAAGCAHRNSPASAKGYAVHDMSRPYPVEVTPGTLSTQDQPGRAPSDAIVLFDGTDLSKWRSDDHDAQWTLGQGWFEVLPGKGNLTTRD